MLKIYTYIFFLYKEEEEEETQLRVTENSRWTSGQRWEQIEDRSYFLTR